MTETDGFPTLDERLLRFRERVADLEKTRAWWRSRLLGAALRGDEEAMRVFLVQWTLVRSNLVSQEPWKSFESALERFRYKRNGTTQGAELVAWLAGEGRQERVDRSWLARLFNRAGEIDIDVSRAEAGLIKVERDLQVCVLLLDIVTGSYDSDLLLEAAAKIHEKIEQDGRLGSAQRFESDRLAEDLDDPELRAMAGGDAWRTALIVGPGAGAIAAWATIAWARDRREFVEVFVTADGRDATEARLLAAALECDPGDARTTRQMERMLESSAAPRRAMDRLTLHEIATERWVTTMTGVARTRGWSAALIDDPAILPVVDVGGVRRLVRRVRSASVLAEGRTMIAVDPTLTGADVRATMRTWRAAQREADFVLTTSVLRNGRGLRLRRWIAGSGVPLGEWTVRYPGTGTMWIEPASGTIRQSPFDPLPDLR